jgi:hypothetical protein
MTGSLDDIGDFGILGGAPGCDNAWYGLGTTMSEAGALSNDKCFSC